jgi:pimeloyl-ACP methyl ester carboxylesterase
MKAKLEPIVGRYMQLVLGGREHRVYFEEAGTGVPLLCLHTAGADGRQFRALLNDAEITRNFRVVVFDMPWHGKSSPPAGWEQADYQLTSDAYVEMILAVSDALELDRPVAIGCSIGGRIVLHLGMLHPQRFRALIGLQSSAHVDPYYDLDWLHRSDASGGETAGGIISGLVGPDSPSTERWETIWHYMQGGPGVFKGDLHFYKLDGDMREKLGSIDTRACPLYLLSGEYDYSAPPAEAADVARRIRGAEYVLMPGLGHFPMSENPAAFRTHLLPVLEQILKKA